MSKGIGAHANKVAEDEVTVTYAYGGYNLNDPAYRNEEQLYDGTITIQKGCFVEPEIHEILKKLPNGRKRLVIKRIPVDVEYGKMIEDGRIVVKNCSNCWHTSDGGLQVDVMARHLLFCIFRRYQEDGAIPGAVSYNI